MRTHRTPTTPPDARHPRGTGQFARLDDLHDYRVARGEPDVRGWSVKTGDGQTAGRVDSLIVDTEAMQVRYLDIELDHRTFGIDEQRHVLVPIAHARLQEHHDEVLLGALTATEMASLQPYQPGQPIIPEPAPAFRETDTRQFYATRGGTGAVERRAPIPGEDRDPDRGDDTDATRSVEFSEDEVRIRLAGDEDVLIEKRTGPTGEVVIRKKGARGNRSGGDAGKRGDH